MKSSSFYVSLLFLVFLTYSCTNDNLSSEDAITFKDNSQPANTDLYYDVVNSNDPDSEFDRLSNEEKAGFWIAKYEVFESTTNLSQRQSEVLTDLSDFASKSHLNQEFDMDEFNDINRDVIAEFHPNQAMDLIYYFDFPSTSSYRCFWCDEIVDAEDCEIYAKPQGGYFLARVGFVQRYRFGIAWGSPDPVLVPCTPEEWVEEDPNN